MRLFANNGTVGRRIFEHERCKRVIVQLERTPCLLIPWSVLYETVLR